MTTPAAEDWRSQARAFVLDRYPVGFSFSANDVWADGCPTFPNRRELGHVLRALEAEGRIEAWAWTGSKGGHGTTIKVYRVVGDGLPAESLHDRVEELANLWATYPAYRQATQALRYLLEGGRVVGE